MNADNSNLLRLRVSSTRYHHSNDFKAACMKVAIKCADISNPARPWKLYVPPPHKKKEKGKTKIEREKGCARVRERERARVRVRVRERERARVRVRERE